MNNNNTKPIDDNKTIYNKDKKLTINNKKIIKKDKKPINNSKIAFKKYKEIINDDKKPINNSKIAFKKDKEIINDDKKSIDTDTKIIKKDKDKKLIDNGKEIINNDKEIINNDKKSIDYKEIINNNKILLIQKYFRGYIMRNYILIPSSKYQTKIWRKNRLWYNNGKSNECEKYQIEFIEKIIKLNLEKTNDRLNTKRHSIINIKNPMINEDGYEYTENFDGKIIKNDEIYYFNLKFVCDVGGAQTRTLRELYHFIEYQLEYILIYETINTYFINILDGDTSYKNMNKFIYLMNNVKYSNIKKYIFIGSLYQFQKCKILTK